MMRRIILIVMLCACWFNLPLSAQPPQGRFSPKEYAKELEAFIAQQACLSPSEADAFFPLFHEMRNKQRAINWEIIEMKRQKPTPNASDKDFYNLIKNITNLKTESIELEGEYYKKMCKAIPAQNVYNAMQAEDKFHRRMLRRFSNPKPHKKGNKH